MDRAYDWSAALRTPERKQRTFFRRLFSAKSKLTGTSKTALAVHASPEEFAHFEECMNNPQGPTPALLEGAELLRKLQAKNR